MTQALRESKKESWPPPFLPFPSEMCQDQGLSHWVKDRGFTRLLQFHSSSSPHGFDLGTSESKVCFSLSVSESF